MKKPLLALTLLGALQAQIPGQEIDEGKLDAHVEDLMKAFDVPGMAIAIVHKGKPLITRGYGARDLEKKQAADADTLFAIGSSSKAFTALGVALLVEDGKIAFTDPVRKHLPTFRMHDDYATDHLTVEDLLCHRSGLPRHDLAWYGSKRTRRDLVAAIRWLEPSEELRSTWQYQNLMFATAGFLVGQKSSSTWEQFTRQRILKPLGMARTNFSVRVSEADQNAATPHRLEDGKLVAIPYRNIDTIGPAGSINSTARDMARWLQVLLGKGKIGDKRVASNATIQGLSRPRMVMGRRGGKEFGYMTYALGWMVQTYRGHMMVHHGGNIDGFSALVTFFPDDDLGVVVLTNLNANPSTSLTPRWVADRMFGLEPIDWIARTTKARSKAKKAAAEATAKKKSHRIKGTKPSHPIANYVGRFEHPGYGMVEVTLKGEQLTARLNGLTLPLDHVHFDVFESASGLAKGTRVQFHTNLRGDIDAISAKLEATVDAIHFDRAAAQRLNNPAFLAKLTGKYRLVAAPQTLTIEAKGKTLFLTVPGQPTYECVPGADLRFSLKGLKGYSVVFKLNESGERAKAIELDQPNGVFAANRVED